MKKKNRIWILAAVLTLFFSALITRTLINLPKPSGTAPAELPTATDLAAGEEPASASAVQFPSEAGDASDGAPDSETASEAAAGSPILGTEPVPDSSSVSLTCRIVSGAETGNLLLAAQDGSPDVYRLNVSEHPLTYESPEAAVLQNGMLLDIIHGGSILETYPAQFGDIREILVLNGGMDNLCELYLNVLNDLWEVDPALNDGITELGVDLSSTWLPESEQAAVALAFGEKHDLFPIRGTYEELTELGYINDELLYWENGCLFSITQQELHHSTTEKTESYSLTPLSFSAQKWRSGTGAYFFTNCTSVQSSLGIWDSYRVGGHAVS